MYYALLLSVYRVPAYPFTVGTKKMAQATHEALEWANQQPEVEPKQRWLGGSCCTHLTRQSGFSVAEADDNDHCQI